MLSTRTRYSIIALCDVARASSSERRKAKPVPLSEIAEQRDLSLCYLEQLAVKWRRAGLVRSVRGPMGGYLLNRPAQGITVADIATAVEETISLACGEEDRASAQAQGCPARMITDLVTDTVQSALSSISLADIAEGRLPSRSGGKPAPGQSLSDASASPLA